MRVLMFGWEFPPRISGGLGRACYGMTRGLADRDVDVTFVMPVPADRRRHRHMRFIDNLFDAGGGRKRNGAWKGQSLHFRPIESILAPYMTEAVYRSLSAEGPEFSAQLNDLYGPDILAEVDRYASKAASIAEEGRFDVIHGHDWMTVPAALGARSVSGKPVVVHIHSLESDRSGTRMNERIYAIERTGMMEADAVIAVSRYTADRIVAQYGIPRSKVDVVHNAAALPDRKGQRKIQKDPSRKYVLFLGRITGQKGPAFFLEAAARVVHQSPRTDFIMAGDGDLLPRMREMVRDMHIEDRVHFTGFVSERDVELLFRFCDLFILPSISEPFGMTVLEALTFGTPVIVSKSAGVLEVVPDCLTVDPRNVEEMTETIMAVLDDGDGSEALVERCRRGIHDLTWENVALRLIDIYRRVTSIPGGDMI